MLPASKSFILNHLNNIEEQVDCLLMESKGKKKPTKKDMDKFMKNTKFIFNGTQNMEVMFNNKKYLVDVTYNDNDPESTAFVSKMMDGKFFTPKKQKFINEAIEKETKIPGKNFSITHIDVLGNQNAFWQNKSMVIQIIFKYNVMNLYAIFDAYSDNADDIFVAQTK